MVQRSCLALLLIGHSMVGKKSSSIITAMIHTSVCTCSCWNKDVPYIRSSRQWHHRRGSLRRGRFKKACNRVGMIKLCDCLGNGVVGCFLHF